MNMTSELKDILDTANRNAKNFNNEYETPEHILYAINNSYKGKNILFACGADNEYIKQELENYFKYDLPCVKNDKLEPVKTVNYDKLIENTSKESKLSQKEIIDIKDLLLSLYDLELSKTSDILREAGIKRLNLLKVFSHGMNESKIEEIKQSNTKYLESYSQDLTLLAKEKKLEPVIAREDEIRRVIQILCRKYKNNPILVGEAGVGKTAVAEGFAQLIVNGNVPKKLEKFRIYSLNIGNLMSGTKYRGTFEKRLKNIIKEIINKENIIIFIDEIHTLIGAGAVSGNTLDVANILKPYLARGEIRCIGSTTIEEYNKYFEKDKAMSRRFQKVEVNEPNEENAVKILNGLKKNYENYHNVQYTDEAIKAAVHLSALYINERYLPDKAIDLIDEAGALMNLEVNDKIPVIDSLQIEALISKITHIPQQTVSSSEKDNLLKLEERLKQNIFGQDNAIAAVVNTVKRSRVGFRAENKPIANFLFAGPTGVGKTELTRKLAEILGITMIRFDMSEYQEKYTVSRLIGSAPGYIGYENSGLLTEAIRRQPHSVLLLDEIEKAHADIYNVLLQIMDYATLTDNQGRKADFRNVILIMTSNAGARDIGKGLIGFGNRIQDDSSVDYAVEKIFSPEFRNRLDAVVHFAHLSRDIMVSIVEKELDVFSEQLAKKNITYEVTETCMNKLIEDVYRKEFGARNVSRFIENKIKSLFIDEILYGELKEGGQAVVDYKDGVYMLLE